MDIPSLPYSFKGKLHARSLLPRCWPSFTNGPPSKQHLRAQKILRFFQWKNLFQNIMSQALQSLDIIELSNYIRWINHQDPSWSFFWQGLALHILSYYWKRSYKWEARTSKDPNAPIPFLIPLGQESVVHGICSNQEWQNPHGFEITDWPSFQHKQNLFWYQDTTDRPYIKQVRNAWQT